MDMNKLSSINSIDEEIIKMKNKLKDEDFDSPKYSFKLSEGSIRAIEILDDEIYNNIFKIEELNPPLNDIIIKIGSFIKEYISEFDFTKQNIYKLKKLSTGKEDKLKPRTYENICKTTALIAFIIRDSLEYCGVIPNEKSMVPNVIISYLEYIKENLNECKEYIDFLQSYK